ncbi:heterokaryon incompatibility [Trichoderma cornu-damae]|uniref:Heterokaryon incompatibility n=1 Tax=Trichoderma cornu-damae TaxID=654480 RepID=A0A9P8QRW9_9HYPO|nr:heterokaryon incompatibility [Trichoderma cornu-damae]
MKKFSKILSRRLGRSGGGDDHGRWDAGLESALDFHQLTSRRWRSGDDGLAMNGDNRSRTFTKEVPRHGAGRILADGTEGAGQLCHVCEDIDFASLLDWRPGDARPWVSLAHCLKLKLPEEEEEGNGLDGTALEGEEEEEEAERRGTRGRRRRRRNPCPWCVFFHSMITTVPEGDETGGADGRDGKALKGKFTPYLRIRLAFERLGGGEKHALGKSVLFEVTTRNRSLPWGYIVKAAPAPELELEPEPEPEPEAQTKDAEARTGTGTLAGAGAGAESGARTRARNGAASEPQPWPEMEGEAEEHIEEKQAEPQLNGPAKVDGRGQGEDEPSAIRGREISPLLRFGLAKKWIDFCSENHEAGACTAKHESLVKGLKLIDCQENKVVLAEHLSTPIIHDPPHDDEGRSVARSHNDSISHHNVDYVTLSYVWGSPRDAEEGAAAAFEREPDGGDGRLPRKLPKLVADAVSATKGLGYRYLWVDRYCIPRKGDAEGAPERQRQLDLMGQIYSRSALTLVVAAGHGIRDGITGVSVAREEQLSIQTESGLFTTSLLRPDLEVASSRWASRAWTYQEGLLSRRRLVFTPSQIYFQCQALHCHESLSLPLEHAPGLNFGRVFPSSAEDVLRPTRWKNHIKAYLAKSIAHADDRLDAFRGLLYEYSRREQLPMEHLLGLPLFHPDDFAGHNVVSQTDRLAVALGWMPGRALPSSSKSATATSSHDDLLHGPAIDPYCLVDGPCPFPSWTWLAWRPNQTAHGSHNPPAHSFNFNLVDDASPLLDGVSAAPGMEISVGFSDGMVLSWEIDGDAIARKADRIEMLRLKTFCFDLTVREAVGAGAGAKPALSLAEPAASALGKSAAESVEAWIRRSSSSSSSSAAAAVASSASTDDAPAGLEHHLVGVLVSGRHWRCDGANQRATGAGKAAATALICGRKNWDPEGCWVRLGALSIAYDGLVPAADEGDASIMKGIDARSGEKKDLRVRLRELDIY